MEDNRQRFPGMQSLIRGLASIFCDSTDGEVTVLRREANIFASTSASEIVVFQLPNGTELRFICKYGGKSEGDRAHGHRGGVEYEADVYRFVLHALGVSVPRFDGAYAECGTGRTCLVIEQLTDVKRFDELRSAGERLGLI
jgi:hypothetical protein